jgi:hypothetical protein
VSAVPDCAADGQRRVGEELLSRVRFPTLSLTTL